MIVVFKQGAAPEAIERVRNELFRHGITPHPIDSDDTNAMGLVGNTSAVDVDAILRDDCVARIVRLREPYKLAGRGFHPADSVIRVGKESVGGGNFVVIAGPCSVESEEQILEIARDVKLSGAAFLRGGAFKPRSSPYVFQGLGLDGLCLLKIAREKTGLPIVSEILSAEYLDIFAADVDVIQIGARNMQNFQLLREVGSLGKPVLLKRGLSSTIEELLMAAEYVMAAGKSQVILCERGIRTFETATRNTLDLSAVPVLKRKSHLPVVVDPSHGTGHWNLVSPMALAAVASGADGLIIEVHNQPERALCDGAQSLTPALFHKLMRKVNRLRLALLDENEDIEEVSA